MIKNIIFDLGNVVYKLNWSKDLEKFTNIATEKKLLSQVMFESKEWIKLDQGIITRREAIKIKKKKLPSNLHIACEKLVNNWSDSLILNSQMFNFIKAVRKKGYKIYILSNAPIESRAFFKQNGILQFFDGAIFSAEEKIVKPDKRIYKILLNRYNLRAEECLFLDDRKENIDSALELNFNRICF